MRVFVTGATGFIGSAIVQDLIGAGHQVLGLARSDDSAAALARLGVEAHRGDLADLDSLVAGARACEGVIHTAFIHDFSQFMANIETDRRAVEALACALEGSDKPLVIASGTMMVQHARPATERDAPLSVEAPRAASEAMVLAAADRGVRGSVVRLPPTVHGAGDHGFVPRLIEAAREHGVSPYVGDGANHWPAVHRLDAARVFRRAVERAAPGTRLHAVGEEGVPMRAIAEAIGAGLGVPVRSLTQDEAPAHFGFLAMFIATDNPTSSALTRSALGWSPEGPDLLTDLREGGYFH
ncbi:SDR family oxidoreductase [Phenylobacterium sp.]|uniref:SDR family oxidoreductase n=1 Tax=Phenylobacterium sp. TaxID=1871053 RepID=UPI0025FE8BC6|nr:SDR family oxidoreductase [Phenylobacterium sp.]